MSLPTDEELGNAWMQQTGHRLGITMIKFSAEDGLTEPPERLFAEEIGKILREGRKAIEIAEKALQMADKAQRETAGALQLSREGLEALDKLATDVRDSWELLPSFLRSATGTEPTDTPPPT